MDEKKGKKKGFILDEKTHNVEKVEIFEIIKWMKNWGLMIKSSKHIHLLCTFLKL
jgi:hypothetical protein